MQHFLALFLVLSVIAIGCDNEQTDQEPQQDSLKEPTTSAEEPAKEPVDLAGEEFHVLCGEAEPDSAGMYYTNVMVESSAFDAPQFLVREYGCREMREEEKTNAEIPEDAVFSFTFYYAGLGGYYYGVVEGNQLKVWRKYHEEAHPDLEPRDEDYVNFKTFSLYTTGVEVDSSEAKRQR